ncbi:MAG: hypothetical protein KA118_07920, partial [Verrucomicrobia bacterium]|nr:hypothetical protein [Verrucomicrobiota bacterium]
FFKAEAGIRVPLWSRGLGDVYKGPPPAPSVPADRDDFKNDPKIKEALEIFRGQIVDVGP